MEDRYHSCTPSAYMQSLIEKLERELEDAKREVRRFQEVMNKMDEER